MDKSAALPYLDVAFRSIDCHRLFLWGRPGASGLQATAKVNKLCPRDGIIELEFPVVSVKWFMNFDH
jgi:hypothetical protein